jgi:hypothetical protein
MFRKMHCVKGNYAVVFFNFTNRTDEVMMEDYKRNKEMVMYDEGMVIEKKIEDIETRKIADTMEVNDGTVRIVENESESNIEIKQEDVITNLDDVTDYIYSTMCVAIFYHLEKPSLPPMVRDRTCVIIRWEKYPKIKCKFHNLYFLPSC